MAAAAFPIDSRLAEISLQAPNWGLQLEIINLRGSIDSNPVQNMQLKGTSLSCTISKEAGNWKNRVAFIRAILAHVQTHCPKDQHLTLISLGSDYLLVEYILAKLLIEEGFSQISFLLIDPSYAFSAKEALPHVRQCLKDYRSLVEALYLERNKTALREDNIKYLSRASNVAKYFPEGSSVVIVEALPPHAESVKDMSLHKLEPKPVEQLMAGSYIVPAAQANAISFLPRHFVNLLETSGATFTGSFPLPIFELRNGGHAYADWGVKIRHNKTYEISFSGQDTYLKFLGISPETRFTFYTGEKFPIKEWVDKMQSSLQETLKKEIQALPTESPDALLSQENITALLNKIKIVAEKCMPGISSYFLADYHLDKNELIDFISNHASHNYRMQFSLQADPVAGHQITTTPI